MLDPVDNRCAVDPDPRLTYAERARIAGEQWNADGIYYIPKADGSHLDPAAEQPEG
jgi:hypothetical protein